MEDLNKFKEILEKLKKAMNTSGTPQPNKSTPSTPTPKPTSNTTVRPDVGFGSVTVKDTNIKPAGTGDYGKIVVKDDEECVKFSKEGQWSF